MMTMTIVDQAGNIRTVPTRIGLQMNDEMDEQDYLDILHLARSAKQRGTSSLLDELESVEKTITKAHADMLIIIRRPDITAGEARRVINIVNELYAFAEELRQLSFEHALREDW